MKTRKFTMGMTALALMSAMVLPVSAADKQETVLTTKVDSEFTLTIPMTQAIDFGTTSKEIGEVKVVGNINPDEKVVLTVGKTELVSEKDSKDIIKYALQSSNTDFTGAEWTEDDLRLASPATYPLTVVIDSQAWKEAHAGSYASTITFTAETKTVTQP